MPTVITRIPGRKASLVPNWNLRLPHFRDRDDEPLTLRCLLAGLVAQEVEAFHERQKDQRYVTVLSEDEIRESLAKGKVTSGGRDLPPPEVSEEEAIGVALQAFEDGMYLVLIDDEEKTNLDQQVHISEDSTITLIRLTFLAGG
ncbi:hypothetical protein KQI84_16975 [bacterium]|nr:hypothetical protein [bacterium]